MGENTRQQKNDCNCREEKTTTDTGQRRDSRTVAYQEAGYDRNGKDEPEKEKQAGNSMVSPDATAHIVCAHDVRSRQLNHHKQENEKA